MKLRRDEMSELLTVDETAKKLKLHPATIARYIREGKLSALKFGRVWRIRDNELTKFMKRHEVESRS